MTPDEQLTLFKELSPYEFMDLCLEMKERKLRLPICSYVRILLKEAEGTALLPHERSIKPELAEKFGKLDVSLYKEYMKFQTLNKDNADEFVKSMFQELRNDVKQAHNVEKDRDYSSFMELLKGLRDNVDFSANDRKNKGIKYDPASLDELSEFMKEFETQNIILKHITIRLTAKQFMRILLGHVSAYLIPRKAGSFLLIM